MTEIDAFVGEKCDEAPSSKRMERFSQSIDSLNKATEGSLILGKKNRTGIKYHTRYAVERERQNHESFKESIREFFFPCLSEELREAVFLKKALKFLTSEPFILTIHLTAVLLGVLKILLEVRDKNGEVIEEAHSALECIGVCFVLGLRTWVVNDFFHKIKLRRVSIEKADKITSVRGRKLKIFVRIYTIVMGLFCITSIGCTIAFKLVAHLGWTILSNNCLLALGTGLYGIAENFTSSKLFKIANDHHKILIHEMSLLLIETQLCKNHEERSALAKRVEEFLKALEETPEFSKPGYITCNRYVSINRETSMMQIVSYV